MAAKPHVFKLHELVPGQGLADCFALLVEKAKLATRDGKVFFRCTFRDRRRTVTCAVWSDAVLFEDCENHWTAGQIYKLRCLFSEHEKYGPKIEVMAIRAYADATDAGDVSLDDLIDRPRSNPVENLDAILEIAAKSIADEPLKMLIVMLLDRHRDRLIAMPASARQFYPYVGGWSEHVLNVLENCVWLAERYSARFPGLLLNRDLLMAGAILHDIGRVAELRPAEVGAPFEATIPGKLIGHVILGRDMVRDAALAIAGFNPEMLLLLDHLIQSHLTLPEWGSPRLPMIAEALILHHADDLDAKYEMYARLLEKDAKPGAFTDRDPVLGKELLKERLV
jgi:3'-5' exoribonuclease